MKVSHEIIYGDITILTDVAELDLGDILQFWDPNQHFGERMTENLNQTLHTDTAKTVRPAASPWVLLVVIMNSIIILEPAPAGHGAAKPTVF